MNSSEVVFLIAAGVGFALLAVTLVLGEILGHGLDSGHEVVATHGIEVPGDPLPAGLATPEGDGPSWLSTRVLTAALTGFGVVGYCAVAVGLPQPAAWPVAAIGGVGLGAAVQVLVLRPLARQQSNSLISSSTYEGLAGRVTLRIPEGGSGQVSFRDASGARVVRTASAPGEPALERGTAVFIALATERGVVVTPAPALDEEV
ncbi:YqiJ family protein [Motilibacter deserti]|uniref:YqiJ family protein n=1 Tax=Motilibacter deserti TaxID=2714956 RepID=UPI00140B6F31|nr:YqiJ family protein [Motilibacter deserti]